MLSPTAAIVLGLVAVDERIDVSVSFDVGKVNVRMPDPAEATKRAGNLQQQFDAFKGGIISMGMPQAIADSVRIVPAGAQVLIHATASEADVRAMRSKLGPVMTP